MFPPRFSLKFLLLSFAALAALLAVPAWFIAQVRNEVAAARLLIALGQEDTCQGPIPQDAATYSMPRGQIRRWLHYVARSPGEVETVRVLGDESARGIAALARSRPNVRFVAVSPAERTLGDYSLITQSQIDAVSCFESIEWLQFYGRFAPGVDFRSWSHLKRIGRVDIDSDFVPAALVERLGCANAGMLTISCRYDWELDNRLPAETFASFESSSFSNVTIFAALDDRGLELISRAPRLDSLHLVCEWDKHSSPRITEAGIRRACQNLHVRRLNISSGIQITEPTAEALASIRELQAVDIYLSPAARDRLFSLRPELK